MASKNHATKTSSLLSTSTTTTKCLKCPSTERRPSAYKLCRTCYFADKKTSSASAIGNKKVLNNKTMSSTVFVKSECEKCGEITNKPANFKFCKLCFKAQLAQDAEYADIDHGDNANENYEDEENDENENEDENKTKSMDENIDIDLENDLHIRRSHLDTQKRPPANFLFASRQSNLGQPKHFLWHVRLTKPSLCNTTVWEGAAIAPSRAVATDRIMEAYSKRFADSPSDISAARGAVETQIKVIPEFAYVCVVEASLGYSGPVV